MKIMVPAFLSAASLLRAPAQADGAAVLVIVRNASRRPADRVLLDEGLQAYLAIKQAILQG